MSNIGLLLLLLFFSFQSFHTLIANISVYFLRRIISICNMLHLTRGYMMRSISLGLELETHVSRSNVYFSMPSVIFSEFKMFLITNFQVVCMVLSLLTQEERIKTDNKPTIWYLPSRIMASVYFIFYRFRIYIFSTFTRDI